MNDTPENIAGIAGVFVVTTIFGLVTAYTCMLLLGIPLAMIALKARRASYPVALVAGVICGLLVWELLTNRNLQSALWMALYGLAVSAGFAWVFRRKRWSASV